MAQESIWVLTCDGHATDARKDPEALKKQVIDVMLSFERPDGSLEHKGVEWRELNEILWETTQGYWRLTLVPLWESRKGGK